MIRGIGTSGGIGIGTVLQLNDSEVAFSTEPVTDPKAESRRMEEAVRDFVQDTEKMAEGLDSQLGGKNSLALVLKNQIYLIRDPEMTKGLQELIGERRMGAEAALHEMCERYSQIFRSAGNEEMNQRIADIHDMEQRMLRKLQNLPETDLSSLPANTVIVARELQPSVTAVMDTAHVVGIVAETGGETSHVSILARALEIPAVLSAKDACRKLPDGCTVIVDGEYGEVFPQPVPRTMRIFRRRQQEYREHMQELKQYIGRQTETADGRSVCLAANIAGEKDARKAVSEDAEGVGLFRTEFLFMNGRTLPTEEEQFEAYRKAAVLLQGKPLTIRTLDIGGDKDIPYMGMVRENNPFLGYRAIRFCLGRVDVYTAQLRAIVRASAYGTIRIMIPMVTTVEEIRQTRTLLEEIKKSLREQEIPFAEEIPLGIMIETPAAAIMADVLAKEADFFSIGTNDLTQYMMAVDRGNENVAYLYSVLQPAVLRAIRQIIRCARRNHVGVGMCGEAAGNEAVIPLLLSFGLEEFSVSPSRILETRERIAGWTMQEAGAVTAQVMQMTTAGEIATYLTDYLQARKQKKIGGQSHGEDKNGTGI